MKKFLVLLSVILLLLTSACGVFPTSAESGTTTKASPATSLDIEVLRESIMNIQDLRLAFHENAIKAGQLYNGKPAEFVGFVTRIYQVPDETFIFLTDILPDGSRSFYNIRCYFSDEAKIAEIANINMGDTVYIIGIIEGDSEEVIVKDCMIDIELTEKNKPD